MLEIGATPRQPTWVTIRQIVADTARLGLSGGVVSLSLGLGALWLLAGAHGIPFSFELWQAGANNARGGSQLRGPSLYSVARPDAFRTSR